ncbi:hypothetical protein CO178_02165 [candidate division WWE3 bacterium CG_4_9_14_3_um_filter_34_6]|uniref:Fimbrial assembly protein n=1 Tax=candidate division WWE3 bacterium CG_4_9_14_3_um_filter_34_6 TaxID=1975079 RepID=A0A2M7X2N0_UNCKA|nr:MAG: hypothetical protein CO178_02165 [candidate division WWE3 bacterium CG_4_9_14_3_um_filter_34_6]
MIPPKNEINFMPENESLNSLNNEVGILNILLNWITQRGKLLLIATLIIVLLLFAYTAKLDANVTNLSKRIEENQKIILSQKTIEQEHLNTQKKLEALSTILSKEIDWTNRLTGFTNKIPTNVKVDEISYSENDIKFSAKVNSVESFATLIQLFISDDNVSELLLTASKFDTETKEYIFSLEISLKGKN